MPAASRVSVVPLAAQTLGVVDANDTGKPDVAVATKAAGVVPSAWLPGEMKLMVCAPIATETVFETGAAAA